MTVTVSTVAPAALYRQHPGQTEPQNVYVEVDLANRHVSADYEPMRVHGRARRYPIPALTSKAANKLLEQIRPLAERMVTDWEDKRDGSNHKAVLGDDAAAAENEIADLCAGPWEPHQRVTVWDVGSATNGGEAKEYGITSATTDQRLREIENEILAVLTEVSSSSEVVLEGVVWDHLVQLRDDADE